MVVERCVLGDCDRVWVSRQVVTRVVEAGKVRGKEDERVQLERVRVGRS